MKDSTVLPKSVEAEPMLSIEERLTRIEIRLGLRPMPIAPPPQTATCSKTGLTMPARFFPASTSNQSQISLLWSTYNAAPPKVQEQLALPRTLSQSTFDAESQQFFEPDERLTTARLTEFLKLIAKRGLGRTAIRNLSIRHHSFGQQPY